MSGCSKKRIIFAAVSIFTLYLNTVSLRAQSTLIGQLSQAREGAAHSQTSDGSFKRHRFSMWAVYMLTLHSIYLKHLELLYNAKIFYFCHLEFI